ncbi:MAG: hypothetical protein AAFQ63_02915 [Cyanobacteria bacterium J06621_11]
MKNAKLKRLKQLGLAVVGAYVLAGCPGSNVSSNATSNLLVSDSDLSQETVSKAVSSAAIAAEADATAVNFEVCASVDSWQRPSAEQQAKQLGEDARYANAETDSQLKRASEQFWQQQAVSFTTYGLSARMEPTNLSGVWTVADELWSCYTPETTVAINEGEMAETWLLNQQITNLQWEGDRYLMTVEPAPTGMQVIQFGRVDDLTELPLEIVTESGTSVEVVSGDWQ